jgi:hypothetical protein
MTVVQGGWPRASRRRVGKVSTGSGHRGVIRVLSQTRGSTNPEGFREGLVEGFESLYDRTGPTPPDGCGMAPREVEVRRQSTQAVRTVRT